MALSEKLAVTQEPPHFGPRCSIWVIRQNLEEQDRQALDEAIQRIRDARDQGLTSGQSAYNCQWLQKSLGSEGHPVSVLTVQKHVRFGCSCGS